MYNDGHLLDFEREGRITASQVAAILGHDPYTSRAKAWRRIMGKEPPSPPNSFMTHGIAHEEDALDAFQVETGIIISSGHFFPHPKIEWLGASPDGIISISGNLIPLEVKCPQNLPTLAPMHYWIQVQTQIECLNAPYGWFYAWTEEGSFLEKITRDKLRWKIIEEELLSFYEKYILTGIEPERMKADRKVSLV